MLVHSLITRQVNFYLRGESMSTYEIESNDLHVNAQLTHVKGRVRLDGQITNTGDAPLEDVKIQAMFNRADLSAVGASGDTLHYLLPGKSYEVSVWLEPRASSEDVLVGLKVRAKLGQEALKSVVQLDPFDIKVRGRPYNGEGRSLEI